jgi:hypothetical protein
MGGYQRVKMCCFWAHANPKYSSNLYQCLCVCLPVWACVAISRRVSSKHLCARKSVYLTFPTCLSAEADETDHTQPPHYIIDTFVHVCCVLHQSPILCSHTTASTSSCTLPKSDFPSIVEFVDGVSFKQLGSDRAQRIASEMDMTVHELEILAIQLWLTSSAYINFLSNQTLWQTFYNIRFHRGVSSITLLLPGRTRKKLSADRAHPSP